MELDVWLKLASPFVTALLGFLFTRYLQERPKVITFRVIGGSFHMPGDAAKGVAPITLHSHQIVIRNVGRKPAHNVRLGHFYLPDNINIWPTVQYQVESNPKQMKEIVFPILVPKEEVAVSYLYFQDLTADKINSYAKSDEGFARVVTALPIPQPSPWVVRSIIFLTFVGASFLLYWIAQWAILLANYAG